MAAISKMGSTQEAVNLMASQANISNIPEDLLTSLRSGTTDQYLDVVSKLALDPAYTSLVFITHQELFPEICSRWMLNHSWVPVLRTLAKILPLAPYLSSYARALLHQHSIEMAKLFNPYQPLIDDLLMVFRLLAFNNKEFAHVVSPSQMQLMINHPSRPIKYLAIRILCLYLHASDNLLHKMIKNYVNNQTAINAPWESKEIDYFFLSLWEQKRLRNLRKELDNALAARDGSPDYPRALDILKPQNLSPCTGRFGRILLPRLEGFSPTPSSLAVTKTTEMNMDMLAKAVRDSNNVLVTGLHGAGKSALIRDLARELCRTSSTTTLHLNEQTDIKILLGLYTGDSSPGSFSWHPGVLTQAVVEGRWVVVEDIDRAPAEIISTLLPLLERGEIFVQNRNESIRAAPGFKIIATIRSFVNPKGDLIIPSSLNIGSRLWTKVSMAVPDDIELSDIVSHRYSVLLPYMPKIMGVYRALKGLNHDRNIGRASAHASSRVYGLREMLRWCRRLNQLLRGAGVSSGHEPISESTNDEIFLEAIDCFAGFFASGATKAAVVGRIARELQFPAERVNYYFEVRKPDFYSSSRLLRIGRVSLSCETPTRDKPFAMPRDQPFAMTSDSLRILESVCKASQMAEPCLLVGETGTGKTAIVQYLAALTHTKLTVVNLSQQSEAGDLLGGYKPVSLLTLAIPMMEDFEELFRLTFSAKRNERYVAGVAKAVEKRRWGRVVAFWQEALQMVQKAFGPNTIEVEQCDQEHRSKKRRMELPKYQAMKTRWDQFESKVRVFQSHLASGSKGFAFSFVEGNIVKAARHGDWILLDEINLAPPDTLESLADLLVNEADGGPSLLLPESGRSERFYAHKNFRIFGAMNPATDIGKRDMPESLRSRFTEIFVDPSDQKFENLVLVTEKYLGSHTHLDRRAAADVANLFMEVKRLAEQNSIVDGSNQKPHFSLRTLTRTLVYVKDIAPLYGLRRSLYEGFSMSFLTLLSAESGRQVLSLIEKYLIGSQANGRALMKQIPRPPEDQKHYIPIKQYWVAQGAENIEKQPHYILTPFVERNMLNLVRAISTRRFPILLQGPTSSGKTSIIEYLANITGNKFLRINNHEHTDIQEYLGTYVSGADGTLHYQDGILVRALREGSWIVLDELNLAPTDVLEALNRLLDDNKEILVPETQEVVRPHKNFMLFATQNPPGIYGGRKVLSRAFRNRFLELHFGDIPEEELETILREKCQIAPSFCSRMVAVYKKLSVIRQKNRLFERENSFATLRDLFRWALRDAHDREELAVNGFLLLAERVRDADERLIVKHVIEEVMKVSLNEQRIYNNRASNLSTSIPGVKSSIVWTKSMLRLYVLVTEAIKKNEPVLLVGNTGTGKTTLLQFIAAKMDKKLHIVNGHQGMETSDLIGSQRPVRNKAHLEAALAQDLALSLKLVPSNTNSSDELPALLSAYDAMNDSESVQISPERRVSIEAKRTRTRALFEWADGSLVQAMKTSQYFMFDEISLADDSVLERLNSVLEPTRTLFLAEKATDTAPITASAGFQIYATMNPGGDYGKKELSPALRNRFTELWVPNYFDEQELLDIILAKLTATHTDLAVPMIAFAAWYSSRYNPITPSISIRDLLSWVDFVNKFGSLDRRLAVFEGAAMVYIDCLGADPTAKASIFTKSIPQERDFCLSRLSELFGYDMTSLYQQEPSLEITEETLLVGSFEITRQQRNIQQDPSYSLLAPTTRRNVKKIVRALQEPKPILLEGSPGVGKTTLISAIARAIGIPLTRINLSEHTDLTDLFGSDVPLEGAEAGRFGWQQAPLLTAMENGEWVLLDEMNLASQSVLEGLNACLDHRGQIYVPELNQTFKKHNDFVVFAAQNPRQQGGGRKGLPASFVDRFTVVYVENFTPDDLLIICNKAFEDCSSELIAKTTQCISAVSTYMQDSPQGSQWEFNLRDLFRWLKLLSCRQGLMLAGTATDYLDAIFVQRLRRSEDRAMLLNFLKRFFPDERQFHSPFVTLSGSFVQVGLGILARKNQGHGVYLEDSFAQDIDLSVLESMIFCVQNSWPCLLVGPSGCGKTRAVHQLARIVGADIFTIALNAETDLIDLVGGFEQVDPQRRVREVIKNVMKLTRQTMLESIVAGNPLSSCIDVLQGLLQQPAPVLQQVIESIRECARQFPAVDFGSLAEELEDAMQHTLAKPKAQFRWVDGALVNALKDGAWLILDNANLCSPSILDRLNSLLEPNGFLSINEHRAADGTARIVKPHPDFRLFLTVDPAHGELSRAMRNRSVELYLLPTPERQHANLMLESSISRFAMFDRFDWQSIQEDYLLELFKVCYDHLAFSDISVSTRWWEQVEIGLGHIPSNLSSTIQTYYRMLNDNQALFGNIQETYQRVAQKLGEDITRFGFNSAQASHYAQIELPYADAICGQTIHPMNNTFLVRLAFGDNNISYLQWQGAVFDVSLRFYCFQDRFQRLDKKCMSRLELTLAPKRFGESELVVPIRSFLEKIEQLLHHALARDLDVFDYTSLKSMTDILLYAEDLLGVVENSSTNESTLQTYQTIGKSIVDGHVDQPTHQELVASFSDALALLGSYLQLKSGLMMELMWSLFNKTSPRGSSNPGNILEIEELSDRFDALSWSGAPIEEVVVLRSSIARIFDALDISHNKRLELLKDTRDAMEAFEKAQGKAPRADAGQIFQIAFEGLQQYSQSPNIANPKLTQSDAVLSFLSRQPTKSLIGDPNATHTSQLITLIEKFTGVSSSDAMLTVIRDTMGITILQKIASVPEVHVGSFDMLCAELKFLANRTATMTPCLNVNHLLTLHHMMGQLQLEVIAAHEKFLEPASLAHYMKHLDDFEKNSSEYGTSPVPLLEVRKGLHDSGYLSQIFNKYINPSITMLHNAAECRASGRICEDTAATAASWIHFFTGCLILYVPDRVFDPASRSVIERDRHTKRKTELEAKLCALQTFEQAFAGQSASLRSQIVQSQLQTLGEVPPIHSIARPQHYALNDLQTDFNFILETIVPNSPTREALQRLVLGHELEKTNIELLRSRINRYTSRLVSVRLYEDITRPLINLLHGLDIGLGMALIAYDRANHMDEGLLSICRMTPFLGLQPDFFSAVRFDDVRCGVVGIDMRLSYLKSVAVVPTVELVTKGLNVQTMREVFHSFYEEWKEQLSRDQKQHATKSSLYRYRGSEDDHAEEQEQEFLQIFCSDRQEGMRSNTMSPETDPRSLAQAIAACQHNIFDTKKSSSQQVIATLRNAAENLGRLPQNFVTCPVPVDHFLPALIVQLDECSQRLQSVSPKTHAYNFYADANVSEVKKLGRLLCLIEARYSELHEVWPEHVTIQDIIKVCNQLRTTRHTEPVASLLSKAEQLHGFMHEWQLVASREFSTAALYEDLTVLLVDWRRLELSTWAGLLDKEDARCCDDVNALWFVAYEAIIAAPLSMTKSDKSLHSHADQLLSVLAELLLTASIGHFVQRLQLIENFKSHVHFLADDTPAMKAVENALHNFLNFYKRFKERIQSSLWEGRRSLEKDMRDILVLASWKDTNINALRESAKRSHQKLFKVIRKYRTLLAQPAQQFLNLPDPSDGSFSPASSISNLETQDLSLAFQICQRNISNWESRPSRFKYPSATALQMVKLSELPSSAIDIAGYVNDYALSLLDNVKLLRKETPSAKTKENADLVKHLKARKRRLFEETLKDTRQMGFQYNISGNVLAEQTTLSKILSSTPAFNQAQSNKDLATAEAYWHRYLDLLTQIRERSQSPSEDLNHEEISRSIGYLESMLSTTRKERATLAPSFDDLDRLDVVIEKMKNFTDTEPAALIRKDISIDLTSEEVLARILWLSLLLDTSCVLLEKHGRLSDMDNSGIIGRLRLWSERTRTLELAYERIPSFPDGLRSLLHEQTDRQARESLLELRVHLQEWMQEFPRAGFVLRQLINWTDLPGIENHEFQNGVKYVTLKAFDENLCKVSDSILVAIQQMNNALSATPSSYKEGAWLTRSINSLSNGLKILRVGEVIHDLEVAMAQIQHLAGFDKQELQVAGALCTMALPIVVQYRQILKRTLECCSLNHGSLCKLGFILAQSFIHIISEGFCDPASSSANEGDQTEKLEGGTGLGEGEGAEDISKDVQDDEDLSELAQGNGDREGKDLDVQDDAVDMDHNELDGDLKDVSGSDAEDQIGGGEEREDIGEETGDVDASDPGAVDEKLWDGSTEHSREEKEGDKGMGKSQRDEQVAQGGEQNSETAGDDAADSSDEDVVEDEAVVSGEVQKLDPHVQEEQNLDLPEEMNLDGDDHSTISDLEGSDLDEGSPIEHDEVDDQQPVHDEMEAYYSSQDNDSNAGTDHGLGNEDEPPAETGPEAEQDDKDPFQSQRCFDDSSNGVENLFPSGAQGQSQGVDQQDGDEDPGQNSAQSEMLGQAHASDQENAQAVAEEGQQATSTQGQNPRLRDDPYPKESSQEQAFRKLGDTLEQWHRQQQQIRDAYEEAPSDAATAEKDFQHLYDERAQADAQALGAATEEQAQALDSQAFDSEMLDRPDDSLTEQIVLDDQDEVIKDLEAVQSSLGDKEQGSKPDTFIGKSDRSQEEVADEICDEDMMSLDDNISRDSASNTAVLTRSPAEARQLWSKYEALTHPLSLILTEQLRLILAPTLATKMRGDFRTGKRLNIKRIIPYIASNYKRDKIWMRRSVPQKRNYQVMLAVDDSKSMVESGSGQLAFEALVLVAKSLSVLEVGEIAVVGFGKEVQVAHNFDKPFSAEAGVEIIQQFGFNQTKTNIRKLVEESIKMFREARNKGPSSSASDLWQLLLVISDGLCEDHESIRRLVRQAQEERIMIVFVIVDAIKGESIVDMSQAVFEPDSDGGDQKLKIKRYLEGFPFMYYLVVGDVRELPGVLATALRGWFSEVVGQGG